MNRITGESHSDKANTKECLLRQNLTKDLNTIRYDLGGCNSVEECLLPKIGSKMAFSRHELKNEYRLHPKFLTLKIGVLKSKNSRRTGKNEKW